MVDSRVVVLFSKPPVPGRVKTRLIGSRVSARQAADLHTAFLGDLCERLRGGAFELRVAWAADGGEETPELGVPAVRQRGADLGERLYNGLIEVAQHADAVAAVGSDHPDLELSLIDAAFAALEGKADVVFGPATDGGYYLVALRTERLERRLFEGIRWSTDEVLTASRERCRELGLTVELLPPASDVDTPEDLAELERRLRGREADCPRTAAVLAGLAGARA